MVPLEDMNDQQMYDFAALALPILRHIIGNKAVAATDRPALVALWTKGHERATLNVKTEYSIDREGFVDDAVHQGAWFYDILISMVQVGSRGDPRWALTLDHFDLHIEALRAQREALQSSDYKDVVARVCADMLMGTPT